MEDYSFIFKEYNKTMKELKMKIIPVQRKQKKKKELKKKIIRS